MKAYCLDLKKLLPLAYTFSSICFEADQFWKKSEAIFRSARMLMMTSSLRQLLSVKPIFWSRKTLSISLEKIMKMCAL